MIFLLLLLAFAFLLTTDGKDTVREIKLHVLGFKPRQLGCEFDCFVGFAHVHPRHGGICRSERREVAAETVEQTINFLLKEREGVVFLPHDCTFGADGNHSFAHILVEPDLRGYS
jgi:hypothetical protein